ncbi:YfhO family protein [Patescibacteria group bacterium]|nr:YfhO family protein [Patescibacteria group bacterium]
MKLLNNFKHKDILAIAVVLIFGIIAARQLFLPGYFLMHDDLQMMRQLQMEKCFMDGQIPCRWVPDMGFGYGFPLFNYYPPLPYLIGEIFRVVGFSFVSTAKILFIFAFLGSGIAMYFLAKEFFGRFGGVVSSVFYVWAPYHAVDVYVRGAMNEAWAIIWFPLIFWTSYRLSKEKKNNLPWILGLTFSWTALLMSHNIMVLIFTPFFAVWCTIIIWKQKTWNKIPRFLLSGILALGLAAFFTLPALLEQKYIHVGSLVAGYFDFTAHFATLNQIFISRFWGFGGSIFGTNDGMSFQIGHVHWILSLIVFAIIVLRYFKTRKISLVEILVSFTILAGWFAAFMTHNRSTFIWLLISPLRFVQFPWRFLSIIIFFFSFISGYILLILPGRLARIASIVLILLLVVLGWNYFKPEKMGPLNDAQKFSGAAWELQQGGGVNDYLPVEAEMAPLSPPKILAETVKGEADLTNLSEGTNWAKFDVNVVSDKADVRINIFDYPVWKVYVDNQQIEQYIPKEEKLGRMWVNISQGTHTVTARLFDTPIRKVANWVSIFSWLGLAGFLLFRKRFQ